MTHFLFRPLLVASITATSILTGNLFSLSFVSMRSILGATDASEQILLAMWHLVFIRGFYACPIIGFFSSGISGLNAAITYGSETYSTGSWSPSIRVYAILLSGFFMFGMVPYTLKWIVPLEEVLLKKEKDLLMERRDFLGSGEDGKLRCDSQSSRESLTETRRMLELWVALNYGRMVIPFVGVVIAWTIW